MSSPDDAILISRVLVSDDRHAFATLVRRHQSPVRAFLTRLCCGDRATADDLAQDTFLRAYRSLPGYQHRDAFASWLFALAYRGYLSDKRRARHARESIGAETEADDRDSAQHPGVALDIEKAMARLRPEERAAIALCAQCGLSQEEAAQVLDCPLGTLKTHMMRGKAKLRGPLSAYLYDTVEIAADRRANLGGVNGST